MKGDYIATKDLFPWGLWSIKIVLDDKTFFLPRGNSSPTQNGEKIPHLVANLPVVSWFAVYCAKCQKPFIILKIKFNSVDIGRCCVKLRGNPNNFGQWHCGIGCPRQIPQHKNTKMQQPSQSQHWCYCRAAPPPDFCHIFWQHELLSVLPLFCMQLNQFVCPHLTN